MRIVLRLVVAVFAVLLAVPVVFVVVPSSVGAQDAEVRGIDTVRTCLAINRRLDAVLVIDETVSLTRTDEEKERVGALQAVIDAVALAVESANRQSDKEQISASLLIAGFGREFSPTPEGWINVEPEAIPELKSIAESFGDRNKVVGTDYVVALRGARDALDQHAAESSAPTPACRLIVLFSDGEYDFGDQPSGASVDYAPGLDLGDVSQREQAVREGFALLCQPGGLLDTMRSTQPPTVLIGLGLKLGTEASSDSALDMAPASLFQAMATGSGPGVTCGDPESAEFGEVATADRIADLGIGIFCSLNGCAPAPAGPSGQPVAVVVDPGVTSIVIQAAGNSAFEFRLTDPAGKSVNARSDVAAVVPGLAEDVIVEPQSNQFSVARIAIAADNARAQGRWVIETVTSDPLASDGVAFGVSRQSGLSFEVAERLRVTIGDTSTFTAQLLDAVGQAIGPDALDGSYTVSSELREPGSLEPIAVDIDTAINPVTGVVTVDVAEMPDSESTNLYFELRLTGTYSDGQQRQPALLTQSVDLVRGGLPLINSPVSGVRLSGVRGGTSEPTARGSVTIEADGEVAGKACVVSYEQNTPSDVSPALIAAGVDPCVDIPPGGTAELPLALLVNEVQSGEYAGSVRVELTAPNDPLVPASTVRVPVGFAGFAPLCTEVLLVTIVGIVAAVAALVLALLYGLARLAARFPREGRSVAFAAVGVSISGDRILRSDGQPFDLSPGDFAGLTVDADSTGQVVTLRNTSVTITPQPRWFGMPQAVMRAPDQVIVGCEDGVLQRARLGRTGRIRHELSGSWALSIESATLAEQSDAGGDAVAVTGMLWVLRDVRADDRRLAELVNRIRREAVGPTVQAVARRVAVRHRSEGDEGGGGGLKGRLRRKGGDDVTPEPYLPPTSRKL